jgi:MoaA/NifB/PqqE/SkfB family radical SAM enzyme
MSETYCPIPWIFQAVRNNGDIRICCQANVTKNQGVVRHPDGTSFNAGRDSLSDARNAELMKSVRKNMLQGVWSEECARCRQEEQSKLNSRRNYENDAWSNKYSFEWAKSVTADDGSIDVERVPAVYYDLRFGNLCNLACRMCGPTDSHTWYKDYVEMSGRTDYKDTHGKVNLIQNENGRWITANHDYDWHDSETFWDQIEQHLEKIEYVYMAGGEPLMIERHYDFLEKCIVGDYAKNIILEYNTNLTGVQPRVLELWKSFKSVRIGASIDGYGKVIEYQRYPAKWSHIEKNLRKIDELPKNVYAWLAYTVTALNVYHLPEFMLWKLAQGYSKINSSKKKPIITHHVAHHPQSLNIRMLPRHIKEDIKNYFESMKPAFIVYGEHIHANAVSILDSVSNYMMSGDLSEYYDSFIRDTVKLDKIRDQSIVEVVPQYKELFNGQ